MFPLLLMFLFGTMRAAEFFLGLLYLSSLFSFVLYLFDLDGLERVLKGFYCLLLPVGLC